jgi:hypothetical protein
VISVNMNRTFKYEMYIDKFSGAELLKYSYFSWRMLSLFTYASLAFCRLTYLESQLSAGRRMNKDCTDAVDPIGMFLVSWAPITWTITEGSAALNTICCSKCGLNNLRVLMLGIVFRFVDTPR